MSGLTGRCLKIAKHLCEDDADDILAICNELDDANDEIKDLEREVKRLRLAMPLVNAASELVRRIDYEHDCRGREIVPPDELRAVRDALGEIQP